MLIKLINTYRWEMIESILTNVTTLENSLHIPRFFKEICKIANFKKLELRKNELAKSKFEIINSNLEEAENKNSNSKFEKAEIKNLIIKFENTEIENSNSKFENTKIEICTIENSIYKLENKIKLINHILRIQILTPYRQKNRILIFLLYWQGG